MVQKALIILLFLIPSISRADVNLEFNDISIPEFAQVVLKGIIKKNYVISPDVLTDGRKLTISIKDVKEADIILIVTALLAENGISLTERAGFVYLTKQTPDQISQTPLVSTTADPGSDIDTTEPLVQLPIYSYRPRYREIKEIIDLLTFAGAQVSKVNEDIIFYKAAEERQQLLGDLLTELDTPANEVIVKAFIYEVTNSARDINAFSLAVSMLNGKLGFNLSSPEAQNSIILSAPNVDLVISAFNTDNRFRQVSAPSLRVKNGKNSRFSVGTETPVLTSTTQNQIGSTTQSVAYRTSGVILDITPRILDGTIELDITQQLSSFVPTTNGVNNSPTLIKREIKTTVNTKDGELIILGGLDESRTSKQRTALKFLPDWLQNRDDQNDKSDILLVMQVNRL